MILKMGAVWGWGIVPFLAAERRFLAAEGCRFWERQGRSHHREVRGKSGKPALGFPLFRSALPGCGNVGISPAFGEISKGLVERVGSLLLAFHAFHSPVISISLFRAPHRQWKRGGKGDSILQHRSSLLFATPIFLAHSVSLMLWAIRSSCENFSPALRYCSASRSDFSFSYGVA